MTKSKKADKKSYVVNGFVGGVSSQGVHIEMNGTLIPFIIHDHNLKEKTKVTITIQEDN